MSKSFVVKEMKKIDAYPEKMSNEISLADVIAFVIKHTRLLAAGLLLGLLVALLITYRYGLYTVQASIVYSGTLHNLSCSSMGLEEYPEDISSLLDTRAGSAGERLGLGQLPPAKNNSLTAPLSTYCNLANLNLFSWLELSRRLKTLAQKLADSSEQKDPRILELASPEWWVKSVSPAFALTKSDLSEIARVNQQVSEFESTRVIALQVTSVKTSINEAEADVNFKVNFIRSWAAFTTYLGLIERYAEDAPVLAGKISQQQLLNENRLSVLKERLVNLRVLQQKNPADSNSPSLEQLNGDIQTKYLPIPVQIVAAELDIEKMKESIKQVQGELKRVEIVNKFVASALGIGLAGNSSAKLMSQLLKVLDEIQNQIAPSDSDAKLALNRIRMQITSIDRAYATGLVEPKAINIVKSPNYYRAAFLGATLGFLLALFMSLVRPAWRLAKKSKLAQDANISA